MAKTETEANSLGGSDESTWSEYIILDEKAYFDKSNHLERSLSHQPNHKRAVRKKNLFQEVREVIF
jgi:hypothetical protein